MASDSVVQIGNDRAAFFFRPLHEMSRVQAIEVGEAASVVQACFVRHEHDIEVASQLAQHRIDATGAAVPWGKDAKRRNDQQSRARRWCCCGLPKVEAVRRCELYDLPRWTREHRRQANLQAPASSAAAVEHSRGDGDAGKAALR